MQGTVLLHVTEWRNGNDPPYYEAEVYPFSGEIIASADSLGNILTKLNTVTVRNRIRKVMVRA